MSRPPLLCVFSLLSGLLSSPLLADDEPLWLRNPAISPDGTAIVFSFQGDLYRVPSGGGLARPLALSDARERRPVFSPDGRWLAFASDRYGNEDVFVMAAEGGPARRLTFYSEFDFPADFTPDGSAVLFVSLRPDAATAEFPSLPHLYQVPREGGRVRQRLSTPTAAARLVDAERVVYHELKPTGSFRKHDTSTAARDLWLVNLRTGESRRLTTFAGEDLYPVPASDGDSIYYVSEQSGSGNVHRLRLSAPGRSEQLTHFKHHPIRDLSAARDGILCFSFDGGIYTLVPGQEPVRVPIRLADLHPQGIRQLTMTDGATEIAVSPNAQEFAFSVRGEVFVTSRSGTTRRLTTTPEEERWLSFRPDGRALLYASERGGRWNLYVAELVNEHESTFFNATEIDEKPILVAAADAYQPQYSSDGAEIAFLEDGRTLRVLNLASHQIRTIAPVAITADILSHDQRSYRWSPDGRWFLVHFVPPGHRSLELGLIRSDGHGELINVTLSGYNDVFPKWVMGGQVMIWASDRDAPRGEVWAGNWQGDVYAQFMTRWAWDLYRFGAQQGQAGGAPAATIEIEGLRDRRLRLTPRSSGLTDAVIPPNGSQLLYLARLGKGIDLWTTQRSGETRLLARLNAQQASHLTLTADGEHVVMLADGKIAVVSTRSGELHRIPFQAELEVDVAAERAYLYDHVSRQVERIFYDRQLHGVDWDFYVAEYAGFLPHLGGEREFARLLDELLGELNASHCGARSKRRSGNGDRTAALGLFFAETGAGPGLRITGVMAANPVLHAGSRIRTGVVIEAIDGHPIDAGANFYPLLNRQVGKPPFDGRSSDNGQETAPSQRLRPTAASEKPLVLALGDPTSGESWQEVVHPIGLREERELLYRRWVEGRRRTVEELSNRRLGYIHVRRMDEASCRTVVEEVLGRYPEAEGLVVDTRFNSGGYVLDDLLVLLSGTTYLEYVLPDGRKLGMEPQQRWGRPSILVAGKSNYSGAHCLAWSYQHFGIGKVVGTPVPGTCTLVYAEKLLDGTSVNLPMTALAPPDGMPLENVQLEPDVRIENDPSQLAAGRDQQLERAVEELLREIDGPMKG